MAKKTEIININGEFFELMGTLNSYPSCRGLSNIYSAYAHPSYAKIGIFEYWKKWAHELDYSFMNISSHNCFSFSLRANIVYQGKEYHLYITKAHNRAWALDY